MAKDIVRERVRGWYKQLHYSRMCCVKLVLRPLTITVLRDPGPSTVPPVPGTRRGHDWGIRAASAPEPPA